VASLLFVDCHYLSVVLIFIFKSYDSNYFHSCFYRCLFPRHNWWWFGSKLWLCSRYLLSWRWSLEFHWLKRANNLHLNRVLMTFITFQVIDSPAGLPVLPLFAITLMPSGVKQVSGYNWLSAPEICTDRHVLVSNSTSASALHSFRRAVKTHLFTASFPLS